MRQFLDGLPDGGARDVPSGLRRRHAEGLDPLTTQREAEHAYLGRRPVPAAAGGEQCYTGLTAFSENRPVVLSHTEI